MHNLHRTIGTNKRYLSCGIIPSTITWVDVARASKERQNPESQSIIDVFKGLWKAHATPEEAAQCIANILEPVLREDPSDLRIFAAWGILCDAVRAEGSSQDSSKGVLLLLESLQTIKAFDRAGKELRYMGDGRFWEHLPAFSWMFRDYGSVS